MDISIVIRDSDLATLEELAEQQWRTPPQQASALLESVLHSARARATAGERPRSIGRRTSRNSGAVRAEA